MELTKAAIRLLEDTNLGILATHGADGSIHANPIWLHVRDGHPVVNTVVGRLKERDIRRDPRVTLTVVDQHEPLEYVELRGTMELVDEGNAELIHWLSGKYMNQNPFPWLKPNDVRITGKMHVERVLGTATAGDEAPHAH